MDISIRQLTENDWALLRQVRLKALQSDPNVFGSNYESESKYTEDRWRAMFRSEESAIFMLFSGETPIGMTGVGLSRDEPTKRTAIFWGSWLEPAYRRQNLSDLMYRTRIEWARRRPSIEKIIVAHRRSNLSAQRAIQKHGFVFQKAEEKLWSDGRIEDEVWHELRLK